MISDYRCVQFPKFWASVGGVRLIFRMAGSKPKDGITFLPSLRVAVRGGLFSALIFSEGSNPTLIGLWALVNPRRSAGTSLRSFQAQEFNAWRTSMGQCTFDGPCRNAAVMRQGETLEAVTTAIGCLGPRFLALSSRRAKFGALVSGIKDRDLAASIFC